MRILSAQIWEVHFIHLLPPFEEEFFMMEIIDNNGPRSSSKEMKEEKEREMKDFLDRGACKNILREEIPAHENVLPGRSVLAINLAEDGEVTRGVRYVIGTHRDRVKHMMLHSATKLQSQSICLVLTLATIFGFEVWRSDVSQSYLQYSEPLARGIFIATPAPEFELKPCACLQLRKPLYGRL